MIPESGAEAFPSERHDFDLRDIRVLRLLMTTKVLPQDMSRCPGRSVFKYVAFAIFFQTVCAMLKSSYLAAHSWAIADERMDTERFVSQVS